MTFNFTLEDSSIIDSSIFSNVNGAMEDAEIVLKGLTVTNSKLFTDINVSEFCSEIENKENVSKMSQTEYAKIQKVLQKRTDRESFVNALFQHLLSFSEGVAASIVASCILK